MKNLKIAKKLLLTFGIIIGLVAILIAVSLSSLVSTGNNLESFYNDAYQINTAALEMNTAIQAMAKYIGYATMSPSKEDTEKYVNAAEAETQVMREGYAYLEKNYTGDPAILKEFNDSMETVTDARQQVFDLALENKNTEAADIYFGDVLPHYLVANECLSKISQDTENNSTTIFKDSETEQTGATILLIGVAVAAIVSATLLASYITKSLTRPIKEITAVTTEMANGSLQVSVSYQSKDEIGVLADNMRVLIHGLSTIVKDIDYLLSEMANGNFCIKSQNEDIYIGDYV